MTDSGFSLRRARWPEDGDKLRRVRERVFVEEQHVPLALEWDGRDAEAIHLLAEDAKGRPIGTARLLPDGQIGRMAVLADWRGRGVGRRLLNGLLDIAAGDPALKPFLNAQTDALGFYRDHGFIPQGETFMEAGIPHQRMVLQEPA